MYATRFTRNQVPSIAKLVRTFFQFSGVCQKVIVFPSDLASFFFLRWIIWMIEVDIEEDQGKSHW